jgi:hypothetical protein
MRHNSNLFWIMGQAKMSCLGLITPKFPSRVTSMVLPNQYLVMMGSDCSHCAGPGWSLMLPIWTIFNGKLSFHSVCLRGFDFVCSVLFVRARHDTVFSSTMLLRRLVFTLANKSAFRLRLESRLLCSAIFLSPSA